MTLPSMALEGFLQEEGTLSQVMVEGGQGGILGNQRQHMS